MSPPKILALQAMKIPLSSWSELSAQTFIYCFRKTGISDSNQKLAQCDTDDPLKDIEVVHCVKSV